MDTLSEFIITSNRISTGLALQNTYRPKGFFRLLILSHRLAIFAHILPSTLYSVAFAEEVVPPLWEAEIRVAGECVSASARDLSVAISCYEGILSKCVSQETKEFEPCLQNSVEVLKSLASRYGAHEHADEIALQYDPKKCDALDGGTELALQCQFTAYATQAIFGHIAFVWGELPE